jgi:outer membrane protein assembly factor BamD
VLLALFSGCATAPPVEEVPSAESYYQRGLELLEGSRAFLFFHDVNYPQAIELFQEVIDNYPYSEYATLAELKIADVYFEQGSYEEATSYYQDFVELHPNHPEVPYAIYRNGLCSFKQMRDVGRDQTPTQEAVAQFRVLLDRYPNSEQAGAARERLREAVDQLASHDIGIGRFYYDRGDYHAAARRFRQVLSSYPEHTARLHTMIRLCDALIKMNRFDEATLVYERALDERSEAGLDEAAEEHIQELGRQLSRAEPRATQSSCINASDPSCEPLISSKP